MALKVYYGFQRLTPKMVRKPALVVYFENSDMFANRSWVERRMNIVYERAQTEEEQADAVHSSRNFTAYTTFIDDKPWSGDIEAVLINNYHADENHVSDKERRKIVDLLRPAYYSTYSRKPIEVRQQSLFE